MFEGVAIMTLAAAGCGVHEVAIPRPFSSHEFRAGAHAKIVENRARVESAAEMKRHLEG